MRPLILGGSSSRNSGGIYYTVRALGHSLNQLDNMNVHCLMYDDEYSGEDKKSFSPIELHTYTIIGPRRLGFSADMYDRIAAIKPDLIHTQGIWMYLSRVNKQYHARTSTGYIVSPHGMLDTWQLNQSLRKDILKTGILRLYEAKHLQQANCIHALCQSEYDAIRSFGLTNPIAMIPNGIELPNLAQRPDPSLVPCPWGDTSKRKTLLFLSRIHSKKGLDNLLQAWALSRPQQHNWQLVIAGETKDLRYWNTLLRTTSQLNIEDTVKFIGGQYGVSKMACYMDADAFILPSLSEGLPMAVLEAWSYGLPALITPYCNLPEGFSQGAAIAIDTAPDSIAEGIEKLVSLDSQELAAMGFKGRRLVETKFTWEQVAYSTSQLYKWVMGEAAKPEFVT